MAPRGKSPDKAERAVIGAAKKILSSAVAAPAVVKRGAGSRVTPRQAAAGVASAPTPPSKTGKVAVKLIGPPRAALKPWGLPGVWRDGMGRPVDIDGRSVTIGELEELEAELAEHVIGRQIKSPAEYLLFVSLYKGFDSDIRQAAAVQAAPYFDKKQPQLQQTQELPSGAIDPEALAKLSVDERKQILATLQKLGIKL